MDSDGTTEPRAAARRRALRRCRTWAPVIGADDLEALGGYDLVVADGLADEHGDDDAARARRDAVPAGALAISYLSVGTVEEWRPYAREVDPSWTLGAVEDWPGERYVDARQAGWQAIMLREAGRIADRGFDGLYLDNLDAGDEYPRTRAGLVALVELLRAERPDLLLVAQNGLCVAGRLPVDAISHEDTWWRWEGGRYRASARRDTARIVAGLRRQRARGLTVLTLDYCPPGSAQAADVVARSRHEGFVPAVSVLALDRAPHQPPCAGAPAARPPNA